MTRPIRQGDIISIIWHDDSSHDRAKVLHMPNDTGDFLYIKTKEGTTVGINPCSKNLDCIILVEEEEDNE